MNQPKTVNAQITNNENTNISAQDFLDIPVGSDYSIHRDALLCTSRYSSNNCASAAEAAKLFLKSEIDKLIPWISVGGMPVIVLGDKWNNYSLVLAKNIIDERCYADSDRDSGNITWQKSNIRWWLNNIYYESLPPEIKCRILDVTLKSPYQYQGSIVEGNNTRDKIFLLSLDEANRHFKSDSARVATFQGEQAAWWLRSPGSHYYGAALCSTVNANGSIGRCTIQSVRGVRPAFWLNLDS